MLNFALMMMNGGKAREWLLRSQLRSEILSQVWFSRNCCSIWLDFDSMLARFDSISASLLADLRADGYRWGTVCGAEDMGRRRFFNRKRRFFNRMWRFFPLKMMIVWTAAGAVSTNYGSFIYTYNQDDSITSDALTLLGLILYVRKVRMTVLLVTLSLY